MLGVTKFKFREHLALNNTAHISIENTSGIAAPDQTVPYGTALFGWRGPRHFVPGYDRTVPPGQKPFAIEGPRIKLALMGGAQGFFLLSSSSSSSAVYSMVLAKYRGRLALHLELWSSVNGTLFDTSLISPSEQPTMRTTTRRRILGGGFSVRAFRRGDSTRYRLLRTGLERLC
jgi:hypothetical protein